MGWDQVTGSHFRVRTSRGESGRKDSGKYGLDAVGCFMEVDVGVQDAHR